MIGYRTRKIILKLPPFWIMNEELPRVGNSKSNENKNVFVYVFIWCFEFSRSWFSSFNLKKGRNFKIIFPFPYPIIYNPGKTLSLTTTYHICSKNICSHFFVGLFFCLHHIVLFLDIGQKGKETLTGPPWRLRTSVKKIQGNLNWKAMCT